MRSAEQDAGDNNGDRSAQCVDGVDEQPSEDHLLHRAQDLKYDDDDDRRNIRMTLPILESFCKVARTGQ